MKFDVVPQTSVTVALQILQIAVRLSVVSLYCENPKLTTFGAVGFVKLALSLALEVDAILRLKQTGNEAGNKHVIVVDIGSVRSEFGIQNRNISNVTSHLLRS